AAQARGRKRCAVRERPVVRPASTCLSAGFGHAGFTFSVEEALRDGEGSGSREEGLLRRLLLPLQPPLRPERGRALRNVPPGPSGRAAPPAPTPLHLPSGAPHACRVGVPQRGGAGGAASLTGPDQGTPAGAG